MKLFGIHVNKRPSVKFFLSVVMLLTLLPFANAIAAPPSDDPDHGEIRLSAQDDSRQIELYEGQVLVISLESNPSTGYLWEVEEADDRILHQTGKIQFEQCPEPVEGPQLPHSPSSILHSTRLLGAPAKQILRFEAVAAGRTDLQLVYHRPWEKDVKPARTFSLQVQGVGPFTQAKSPTPAPAAGPSSVDSSVPSLSKSTVPADVQPQSAAQADSEYDYDLAVAGTSSSKIEEVFLPIIISTKPSGPPSAYNWCDRGGCTSVKDQGNCGSCWTFGTVGPLESNIKIHDKATRDLSEQYLLSCNTDGWSCRGGWWAHDYHLNQIPPGEPDAGAVYEADFPYQAADIPCGPTHTHHEKVASWAFVGSEYGVPSVAAIKQAILDHGPVSVAVCVGPSFESYSSGVFETNEYCSGDVNHAVVLVGWDDNQGTNGIWHLRNSWGSDWGESGYMRIGYGISNIGYSANYIVYGSGSSQAGYSANDTVFGDGSSQDAYEPDNAHASAKLIAVNGTAQHHTFHETDDVDWAKFTVTAGSAYTITTSNLGTSNDTVLNLYDIDGTTELASNNNCSPGNPASCIKNWTAPASGTYFIRVSYFSSGGGLVNGNFENGPTGWAEYSWKGWNLILPATNLPVTPYSGSWAVWLGGDDDEISYIQQQVTVPSGSPYLAYWHWIASEDWCGYDFGGVIINSTVVDVYDLCEFTNTEGWVKHVVNLSAYAGQSVSLQIRAETDDSENSNLFVDDVSFQTSASSVKNSPTLFDLKNAMPKSRKITPRDVDKEKGTNLEFLLHPQSTTTSERVLGKHKEQ